MDNFKVLFSSDKFNNISSLKDFKKNNNYNLYKYEYDYLIKELKTLNFNVIYTSNCGGYKYIAVVLNDVISDNFNDFFKVLQVPKMHKYYINNCYYNYYYIYKFKTIDGEFYIKKNKCPILDKNNHYRPITVGYINSKGDVLISYTEELLPSSFNKKELVGVELINS